MRSMTGFGLKKDSFRGAVFSVEAKSVNHRYAEVNVRMPSQYLFLEREILSKARRRFARGRIDVTIREDSATTDLPFEGNEAQKVASLLKKMKKDLRLEGGVTLDHLIACRDLFSRKRNSCEQIAPFLLKTVEGSLAELEKMRFREGATLGRWLKKSLSVLVRLVVRIEKESHTAAEVYKKRLREKLGELTGAISVSEERIVTEAAIFADRVDITEEITRLKSHLAQFGQFLSSREPVGRKLDFLSQEMVREINTVGSKSQNAKLTQGVILFKSELEKIREQIQNIE
ncbi:MAG: YicC family protein [Deltaproteobacteria bacterium]|nr:YicC family protein [Deltaproteobacteria bacterium]